MQYGQFSENIIPLCYPVVTSAAAGLSANNLNALNAYHASMFIPTQNQAINRVAYKVNSTTSPSMTLQAGIATVLSTGLMSTVFSASGTTNTHLTTDYTIISFSDFSVTAGTAYYAGVKVSSFTSGTVSVVRALANNVTSIWDWPITDANGTKTAGASGTILYGYNDGVTTQWYGTPIYSNSPTQYRLNATANNNYEVGGKIVLPFYCNEYRVSGVVVQASLNGSHTLVCTIYESDGTTQVANASSTITATMASGTAGTVYKTFFAFGPYAKLLPGRTYYIAFAVTAGAAASANYTLIHGIQVRSASFDTSSCFDVQNTLYTRASAGGSIVEVTNERLEADLVLLEPWSPRRGAGSN